MNQPTATNSEQTESSIFTEFPCSECNEPISLGAGPESNLCEECYQKTPQAIQEKAEREEARRTQQAEELNQISHRLVSPEIQRTDINHPEFNLGWWEKIQGAWNPESSDWLWIHSRSSGRSKTRIAYLAMREWILAKLKEGEEINVGSTGHNIAGVRYSRIPDVCWIDGDDFSEACRVRNQFSLGDDVMAEAHRKVKQAKNSKLLIFDDMTKRKMSTEAVSDGFWEVVKHRHQWDLVTIFTDNVPIDELEACIHKKHAPFIMRRLSERCLEADFDHLSE